MLLTVHETAEFIKRLSDTMELEEWDELVYRSLYHTLEDQHYKTFPASCFTVIEIVRDRVAREGGVQEALVNVKATLFSMNLGDLTLTFQEPHILVGVSSRWTDELKKFADFKDDHDARWTDICVTLHKAIDDDVDLQCKNLAELIIRTNQAPAAFNKISQKACLFILRALHHWGANGRYLAVDTDQFDEPDRD